MKSLRESLGEILNDSQELSFDAEEGIQKCRDLLSNYDTRSETNKVIIMNFFLLKT